MAPQPTQHMQTNQLTFDTREQACSALRVDYRFLKAARSLGCLAFVHGRIQADALLDFLEKNVQDVNAECRDTCRYHEDPPVLRKDMVVRMRKALEELKAQAAPGKRFVGREIAAAVRRELTGELAARLAGMAPEAAAAELQAVRGRILGEVDSHG